MRAAGGRAWGATSHEGNETGQDEHASAVIVGFLLAPSDPDKEVPSTAQQRWEAALWDGIVREVLGLPAAPRGGERLAATRHAISSPWLLRPFAHVNRG